jgi:ABC-type sugar transport system ATPase subunit
MEANMSSDGPKLRMSAIYKTFPGVRALDDVSFETRGGEIVGLVGVNGAGKSTLMNILGGIYQPDKGKIFIGEEQIVIPSPKEAARHGISFIHQEPQFFASQTVAENIFISHLFTNPTFPFIVDKKAAKREARRHLETLGSEIEPKSKVGSLSVGERQIVEIARALAVGSQIVILDEPTSSLSFKEKETLFKVVKRLKLEGKAIIYITHFLDEVIELCDKFVVLRNGQLHGQGAIKDVTKDDIIKLIIGRDVTVENIPKQNIDGHVALRVEKLRSSQFSEDISLEMREGEILGLWGLMGSGRTELVRALLGLDPIEGGNIFLTVADEPAKIQPSTLLNHCGYITENRHADGLFISQPIWKNVTVTALARYVSKFLRFLNVAEELKASTAYIDSLRISAGQGPYSRAETLSGGNQQKVIFAKWLNRQPKILLLDEPTRGVDVGAKLEISGLIRALARGGASILLITSEVEEMVSLSDRVLVMREGRILGMAEGADINNATLMRLALGQERLNV